jgi:hypothetical protein
LNSLSAFSQLEKEWLPKVQTFKTIAPYEQVWSKIISFLIENDHEIKFIDKSSGLITSSFVFNRGFTGYLKPKKTSLLNITVENSSGLENPNAMIVLSKEKILGSKVSWWNARVTGGYNIHLVKENGETEMRINLVNLDASFPQTPKLAINFDIRSTGVFEKKLFETIMK